MDGLKPSLMYPLERARSLFPLREVVGPDNRVNYRGMYNRVRRLASALSSMGVGRGDFVAALDVNSVRLMELAYASALTNSVFVPLNFRLPPVVVEEILEEVKPRLVFYSNTFEPLARLAPGSARLFRFEDYEALIDSTDASFKGEADPDSDYVLLFTSGTTGRPKGVMYTQWKMVLGALGIASQLSLYDTPARLGSGDVILSLIPVFHILSWGSILIAPFIGAKLVFIDKFDPQLVARRVEEEGVTWMNAVPTMIVMLLEAGARFDGLKVLVGGSPVPSGLAVRMKDAGMRLSTIYGATDMLAVSISILNDHVGEEELRSVTHPVPYAEVKIVDENGVPVDRGGYGEIFFRAPWMPEVYWRNPEKTREAFTGDGWFKTGDLGEPVEGGGFRVLDRMKDAIKSGGEWIPSSMLESIMAEVEGVSMAAVLPREDPKWGERPVALYVGPASPDTVRAKLLDAVKEGRIAKWWLPDEIIQVDEFPLTSTGKINKRLLREKLSELIK